MSEVAVCLAGFIEVLELERPHVLGLSWGSGVALEELPHGECQVVCVRDVVVVTPIPIVSCVSTCDGHSAREVDRELV